MIESHTTTEADTGDTATTRKTPAQEIDKLVHSIQCSSGPGFAEVQSSQTL